MYSSLTVDWVDTSSVCSSAVLLLFVFSSSESLFSSYKKLQCDSIKVYEESDGQLPLVIVIFGFLEEGTDFIAFVIDGVCRKLRHSSEGCNVISFVYFWLLPVDLRRPCHFFSKELLFVVLNDQCYKHVKMYGGEVFQVFVAKYRSWKTAFCTRHGIFYSWADAFYNICSNAFFAWAHDHLSSFQKMLEEEYPRSRRLTSNPLL